MRIRSSSACALYPLATKSSASQSSRSGCHDSRSMSSIGSTRPRPISRAHTRLTNVRERRPFRSPVSAVASCFSRCGFGAAASIAPTRVEKLHRAPSRPSACRTRPSQRLIRIDARHAVGVRELPVVDEAVVTRRALQVHAHEHLRDVLRGLHLRRLARVHHPAPDDPLAEAPRSRAPGPPAAPRTGRNGMLVTSAE